MSLLDGRHTFKVWVPTKGDVDRYGKARLVWPEDPIVVEGNFQYLTASEATELGVEAETVGRILARTWPGGVHARVRWGERWWQQHGEAKWFTRSAATSHAEVTVVATGVPFT